MRTVIGLIVMSACAGELHSEPPSLALAATVTAEPIEARFVPIIREAAAHYASWGRVDERPNIAPDLCRLPTPADYGASSQVRLSQAEDSPHGRKLYYLWANAKDVYLAVGARPVTFRKGFTIVKESFAATLGPPPERPIWAATISMGPPPPIDSIEVGGKRVSIGHAKGLYVMAKIADTEEDGTDAGWIYGTITPEGTVTSAGKVSTCMGCHDVAPHERMFGLQPIKTAFRAGKTL